MDSVHVRTPMSFLPPTASVTGYKSLSLWAISLSSSAKMQKVSLDDF